MWKPLVHGRTNNGLYVWPVSYPQAYITATSTLLTTWHQHLGHPHSRVLRFILNKFSLPFHDRDKLSYHLIKPISILLPDYLCVDLNRFNLFLVIYEGHHPSYLLKKSYTIVFLLINIQNTLGSTYQKIKVKSKRSSKNFIQMAKYFDTKFLSLYTNVRGEYKSLDPYLSLHEIKHLTSPPYTPQRVELAKRRHRHIIETAGTLLHDASLLTQFWSFACHHTVYLINRLPTLDNHSPF